MSFLLCFFYYFIRISKYKRLFRSAAKSTIKPLRPTYTCASLQLYRFPHYSPVSQETSYRHSIFGWDRIGVQGEPYLYLSEETSILSYIIQRSTQYYWKSLLMNVWLLYRVNFPFTTIMFKSHRRVKMHMYFRNGIRGTAARQWFTKYENYFTILLFEYYLNLSLISGT